MISNVKAVVESMTTRLFALIKINCYPDGVETKLIQLAGDEESLKEMIPKLLAKDLVDFQTEEQKHHEEIRHMILESDEEDIGVWVDTMSEYELRGNYIAWYSEGASNNTALFTYQIIEITDKL